MTIVARGTDAVGSLHRYVTIIDSDGAVYLVGFGDATDNGYLTSDGQWGNGRDLPESMEFGSVMAAYYNDNTEGVNNLALLPVLAGAGVTFGTTPLVRALGSTMEPFTPSYSCLNDRLHVADGDDDLGVVYDDAEILSPDTPGVIDCQGHLVVAGTPGLFVEVRNPVYLTSSEAEPGNDMAASWCGLIMILAGHIDYTWPST